MGRRFSLAMAAVAVVAGLVVTAVLAFPTGGQARADDAPMEIPAQLEPFVFNMCLPEVTLPLSSADASTQAVQVSSAGSGGQFFVRIENPGVWRVDANRLGVTVLQEDGGEPSAGYLSSVAQAVPAAKHLYECLVPYRFVDESTMPSSSSKLLQLYTYDARVLWPCLAAHGVDVGDPPAREDFASAFRAQAVDPFRGLDVSRGALPHLISAVQDCPLRPSYLG